jgi:hypothetical protein
MAKDSAKPVSSFDAENTGGILSGFLAEEDDFDRHSLLRLGTWGVASVVAVIVAVLANQSSIGLRREQVAAADLARQSQQIQSIAKESQNEARRLASAIDTLNGDRDRLYSRVSVLEQGLDSVTGSLARQNAVATAPQPQPATTSPAATTAELPAVPQNPPPVVAPVDTTMAVEKPKTAAKPPAPATAVVASVSASNTPPANAPAATPSVATPSVTNPAAAMPAPLMASKSMMAPPDAAAGKLIEPAMPANAAPAPSAPDMVASVAAKDNQAKDSPPKDAPAKDSNKDSKDSAAKENLAKEAIASKPNASPAPPSDVTVQRTEFAVDVGGANSVGGLRALWRGLLKTRSNAPLAALQPIIVVKESNTGMGMQLRLVAGPLSDAAAAAKICATMLENERACETTVFDGQRLTMKGEDTPAADKFGALKQGSDKPASEKLATEKTDAEKSDSDKTGSIGPNAEKHTASNPVLMRPGSGKYSYRHHSSKRVVAEEPPPPKPESTAASTISSFFSRR